jgi:hypothetical protein
MSLPAILAALVSLAFAGVAFALHTITFWFAPGADGARSRFDRLCWFARPYPFMELLLALAWITGVMAICQTVVDLDSYAKEREQTCRPTPE